MFSGVSAIQKYVHWLLFLLFEIIAIVLIVNFNQKQKAIFLHSSSLFSGSILKKTAQVGDFLNLRKSNDELLAENARLLQEILSIPKPTIDVLPDSLKYPYKVIPASVINNNIHGTRNYFTIDRGAIDGIQPNMGVITLQGVAGIVKQVSENFSTVMSLLHSEIRISASLDGQDYFGSVSWDGRNFERLTLTEIPKYATIQQGDAVSTNGYSTIFPQGIPIGTVKAFDVSKNGVFYELSIDPASELERLHHVYIIENLKAVEQLQLEEDE